MKPQISVIIPTFNEEKYIRRCLDALKRQRTDFPFEILLIDHDSADLTRKIAKSYPVRIIRESRRGTAVARQKGTESAKGDILAFTEADCVVPPDWIDRIGRHFQTHPDHVGLTGLYHYDDDGSAKKRLSLALMSLGNHLMRYFRGTYPFRGTNSAAKKSVIVKAGGFREDAAPFDDADCSVRVSKLGTIAYDPSFVVETSSRRIKGRFFTYLGEFFSSAFRLFVLGHKGNIRWYKVVR